jgi:Kef-type K+ transport system membrane component KefB
MDRQLERCCGLDVHKETIAACVRIGDLALFGMGGVALWAGSEPVLPAYVIGMLLAGTVGKDHLLIRRLRTLTFGLLTPFYFIRAGHSSRSRA